MTVASGTCAPAFDEVRTEFERNFTERGELGAAVHITVDGQSVVDMRGGTWAEDTLVHVWSCTKGATALCAHMLAARGELDLNAPVTRYWPKFGAAGKGDVLIRHLLSHQAGLPAVREPLPAGAFYDWQRMVDVLAETEPFWRPGSAHGYHGLTFGFLVGEVVRRITGKPLDEFFATEVADPLGLEFWLRLPADQESRVTPTIPPDLAALPHAMPTMYTAAMADPGSVQGLLLFNNGGYMQPGEADSRAAHESVLGAVGGVTNARGLAGLYRPLSLDGGGLVPPEHLPVMGAVASASSLDAVILAPSRFALGFVKSTDNRHLSGADAEGILLAEDAFGHSGIGGSLGFADPQARMSFGYAMNRQGSGLGINDRGQSLVDAAYRALGYRQVTGGGNWYR